MDCRRAKTGLALWVGEDLPDATEAAALRRHVSRCASCARYLTQLQASQDALRVAQSGPPAFVTSIWPQVKSEIVRHEKQKRHDRFNGWIPAVAMAAAVLMIVGVSFGPQLGNPPDAWQGGGQLSGLSKGVFNTPRNLFKTDPEFRAVGERPGLSRKSDSGILPASAQPHSEW
ncbi:anti-sigma factor family protein [Planctellipticum variicoloris]|jgi:hypothetical protein|uniref:anti-sigma factor family protein n=1 Tax=Planctellipticum variicoloris TaxID=3064265 RepID=UPI003013AFF1|nr:hypothetical protein SH412_005402 [Planctomycetaceae bacterium SH412]